MQQKLLLSQTQARETICTYETTYFTAHSQTLPNPDRDSEY